ncbi:hypothetical protein [Streptomyces sp. NBRC 110028]|uniref:hypothetical protein n=1 Tax=Streptomyces sp. NBRC 110028 TaxID=1621260 RepID=UPI0006E3D07B|nr:hypothetical protein [Streptomyces sp. NBRC 110028]
MTTGDPQDRIPAYPGVERFVEAFDKLVIQQRRSRSRVPVVLLTEEGAGRAALLCGAVTATDIRQTWGPGGRYTCPAPAG